MSSKKIIKGLKEALVHANLHAACEHKHCDDIKPGKKRCRLCGCLIYETFEAYCND